MKYIVPFTNYCKNFVWNIFHSLINYFFYIHVKKQHNLNKNCYLFIKSIGLRNRILINQINYGNIDYFKRLELKNIKLELDSNRKIPILCVKSIDIEPKIFTIQNTINHFKIWNNAAKDTIKKLFFMESVYNELVKYVFFRATILTIQYCGFRIIVHNCIVTKNGNKIRGFLKRIRIFYDKINLGRIDDLKISFDIDTKDINIYAKKVVCIINPDTLRNDVVGKIEKIIAQLPGSDKDGYPNVYIKKIDIFFDFQNMMKTHLDKVCFENGLFKSDINIKLWKKDILWIKNILFNARTQVCIINDIRFRIFSSTADKIYKSLRPIVKKYLYCKIKTPYAIVPKFSKPEIDSEYCSSLKNSIIEYTNYIESACINYNYIDENSGSKYVDFVIINNFRVDFEDENGSFLFKDFRYAGSDSGFSLSSKKWVFCKNNVRFLDTLDNNDIIRFEFRDNSMFIHTYRLYINLEIEQYRKTFSIFAKAIDRILDIFTFQKCMKGYIFDKFYLCSFRSIFTYSPSQIDFTNLITGDYSELLNLLDLTNMDIILKDNTVIYPRDFAYILDCLIKNIIEDVIDNNFDTVIKKTPVAMSYRFKKTFSKVPKYISKVYKTINANIEI